MQPLERTTKQGVRDLNPFGVKKKKPEIVDVQDRETPAGTIEVQPGAVAEAPAPTTQKEP